jgi:hypothetical protein
MDFRSPAAALLLAALLASGAGPAKADPVDPAAMKPVDALIAGFNAFDETRLEDAFSGAPNIIDDVAPYNFSGAGAVKRWFAANTKVMKAAGMTGFRAVRAPHPSYFHRDGFLAYAVVPVTVSYAIKGVAQSERGDFTFALFFNEGLGWKIGSAAYTKISDTTEPPIGAGLK